MAVQGKHRYYTLTSERVARVLEQLSVLAGNPRAQFVPKTPDALRAARTCYDHIAGKLGVELHDRLMAISWLVTVGEAEYDVTPKCTRALYAWGVDLAAARASRRRFAFGCLDWSERRPHIGGALGALLLNLALQRRWVERDMEGRSLSVTRIGRQEMKRHFGIHLT